MKHVKLEFDPDLYERIKEAAYLARAPIRRWCAEQCLQAAAGVTPPGPPAPPTTPSSTSAGTPAPSTPTPTPLAPAG